MTVSPILRLLLASALTAGIVPAPAGAAEPGWAASLGDLARAETFLETGLLADSVRAAAALGRIPLGSPGTLPVNPAGVPAELAGPVGRLLAAMETARALVRQALPPDPRLRVTAEDEIEVGELIVRATGQPPDAAALAELEGRRRAAEALVDETALFTAGLVLAEALDRSLPELARLPAMGTQPANGAGCDVVDQPVLCIGNTGSNAYTADRALVIDLGGDDVHTHTAGGASTALPVAITIDLGGNDLYRRPDGGIAQGAGNLGVGMLVDAGGNDVYSITASKGTESAIGQGTNFSSGGGLLADLGGDDSYSTINTKIDSALAAGVGRAAQPGFGLLLDHGAGSDSYLLSARPSGVIETPTEVKLGGLNANGIGFGGLGGVAILSDGGGSDTMTLETVSPPVSPEEDRPITQVPLTGPTGMGAGLMGQGLLRSAPGPTTRITRVSIEAPWSGVATSNVFGRGSSGLGALVDEGGEDLYLATASVLAGRRVQVDDSCACGGGHAEARMSLPNVAATSMQAMGSGSSQGVGLLRDEGGGDEYRVTVEAIATAEVLDERTQSGPNDLSDAIATANAVSLSAQGVGQGGLGILQDLDGDDVYQARNVSRATAAAESVLPDVATEARARSDRAFTDVQAAGDALGNVPGQGIVRDSGGADVYDAFSESAASASPETEVVTREVFSSGQASVDGNSEALLEDRDAGALDVFTLAPPDPACMGTRGEATWTDCGAVLGLGIAEDAVPRA